MKKLFTVVEIFEYGLDEDYIKKHADYEKYRKEAISELGEKVDEDTILTDIATKIINYNQHIEYSLLDEYSVDGRMDKILD